MDLEIMEFLDENPKSSSILVKETRDENFYVLRGVETSLRRDSRPDFENFVDETRIMEAVT